MKRQPLIALLVLVASFLYSAEASPDDKVEDYQEIYEGQLPIILESPHGGSKDIPSIQPAPNLGGRDKYTLELTRLIRDRMLERTGKSPEVVAMLADRKFIDVNRVAGPKAFTTAFTERLYAAHYDQIDAALKRVKKRHGTGLMVLIHSGFDYPVQVDIGINHTEQLCTIPVYVKRHGWNNFHGPSGIGGRLFKRGYEVPGFGQTPARDGPAGVPILTRCRKKENIGIDGFEIEFQGKTLLFDEEKRKTLAVDVADVLLDFVSEKYTKIAFKKSP